MNALIGWNPRPKDVDSNPKTSSDVNLYFHINPVSYYIEKKIL